MGGLALKGRNSSFADRQVLIDLRVVDGLRLAVRPADFDGADARLVAEADDQSRVARRKITAGGGHVKNPSRARRVRDGDTRAEAVAVSSCAREREAEPMALPALVAEDDGRGVGLCDDDVRVA